MICNKCGKENADGSRFCIGCGSPLEAVSLDKQPMSGNVPPMGQQPMSGNVPPMGQQPMSGNVPPMGQQPMDGNMPPMGQPMNGPATFDNTISQVKKNKKPLIIGGVGVVALIIVIVLIVNIFSNMGYKGTLNKLEKGMNNADVDLIMECYPDFYFDDDDDDDDILNEVSLGLKDLEDIDLSFDLISDEEVTDEDCTLSSSDTWQEYIESYYEDHCDDYDDEPVTEVIEAKVKLEIDTDNSVADTFMNALLKSSKMKMIFAKVDGKWCFFRTISTY